MSIAGEKLAELVMALPLEERVELADRLAESLAPEIDRLWTDEAQRRLEEVRSGNVQTVPGDEVFEEARRIVSS